jgi:ribonuclease P protein component
MLRTPSDFAALSAAPGVTTPLLGVRHRSVAATGNTATLRLGIATSRKVGNAVVRNRIRRRLKSIAREIAPQVRPGTEILIGVRAGASSATSAELRAALTECLRRARLVEASA